MKELLIVLIFFVAGCSDNHKKTSTEISVTTNIDGGSLFKNNCASCGKMG